MGDQTDEKAEERRLDEANVHWREGRYDQALRLYEVLADLGNPECMVMAAWIYQMGCGESPDLERAKSLYERAAAARNGRAAFELACICTSQGELATGATWMERSVELDYLPAMYQLALRHLHGFGVPRNAERGRHLMQAAGDRGHLPAKLWTAGQMLRGAWGLSRIPEGLALAVTNGWRWLLLHRSDPGNPLARDK